MIKVKEDKEWGWTIYFVIGTQLAVSIVAGLLIGSYVDKWMGSETPIFTIIGLIAGVVSGFTVLVRIMKRKQ